MSPLINRLFKRGVILMKHSMLVSNDDTLEAKMASHHHKVKRRFKVR